MLVGREHPAIEVLGGQRWGAGRCWHDAWNDGQAVVAHTLPSVCMRVRKDVSDV